MLCLRDHAHATPTRHRCSERVRVTQPNEEIRMNASGQQAPSFASASSAIAHITLSRRQNACSDLIQRLVSVISTFTLRASGSSRSHSLDGHATIILLLLYYYYYHRKFNCRSILLETFIYFTNNCYKWWYISVCST